MRYDPDRHHRRSVRLKGWDYASAGAYFVTICTEGRVSVFGGVVEGEMVLNTFGQIAEDEWIKSEDLRAHILLDAFVIMPNHMHGIVFINDSIEPPVSSGKSVGAQRDVPSAFNSRRTFGDMRSGSIASLVRGYKGAVTRAINAQRGTTGATVWQRNYHEHIIRDRAGLEQIREYVAQNALRWEMDRYHPDQDRVEGDG